VTAAPLSAEERAERDRAAKAIGILPKDELDELNIPESEPVAPATQFIPSPRAGKRPTSEALSALGASLRGPDRQNAREFLSRPQLPDFKKVQQFDLMSNTIYVDGMAFPIPQEDVLAMKSYAVQIVLDHVVHQLAQALIEFGVPAAAAMAAANRLRDTVSVRKEEVQSVQGELALDGVPTEQNQEAGLDVSAVSQEGSGSVRPEHTWGSAEAEK
jgi:hypothetical protein